MASSRHFRPRRSMKFTAPLLIVLIAIILPSTHSFSPALPLLRTIRSQDAHTRTHIGSPFLYERLPTRSARRVSTRILGGITAMDQFSMDLSIFYEGYNQGYALFEFIGRRLPTAFFKELGTPHRSPMWIALFMMSNIAFPIAGIKILVSRERANRKLAIFVFLVGVISSLFHWSQCSLGSGSPITHTWCLVDTTFSCVSGLVYLTHSWGTIRKRMVALFGLGIMLLFDTSKFYTVTHSLWHICSAYVAYRLVKDRDIFVRSTGKKTPLISKTGEAILGVLEAKVTLEEGGKPKTAQ